MTEHEEGAPGVPEAQPAPERRGARRAFRHWRRTRPFWGGLLVTLGGGEMLALYRASLKDTMHMGLYGLGGYLVPVLLVILGLSLIFDPLHRTFYSVLSLLFSVASWMTSNLGGFIIGMLLAMAGASLAFGWAESQQPEEESASVQEKEPEGLPTA
ncbi:hypothetical protein KGQ20_20185 [Catenulispora sp. NF23]|uniref:DUF6114 domain-containing protein n=1 Tax=Catenulispora pinistramenti TaxID=2705254 RepID=UPI001BAB325F|nr:DUF6114 domain-containing protein [Catenulispora pinistramenti]MBS2535089.1 hypothetical protein [Catenulispora pinistramenti]